MDINDQLDENAADLRNFAAGNPGAEAPGAAQPGPAAAPASSAPAEPLVSGRAVSRLQIIIAAIILIGLVTALYFFLQSHSIKSGQVPSGQPLIPIKSTPRT